MSKFRNQEERPRLAAMSIPHRGNEAADDMENAKHSCSLDFVGIFHVLCVGGWMM